MLRFEETIYTAADCREYQAIQIAWSDVKAFLGRDHRGTPDDDAKLVQGLLAAGAPVWVKDASGWVDECGWGLIAP